MIRGLYHRSTLRLMLLSNVVHLAVIASLGPVFAFFAASTDSCSGTWYAVIASSSASAIGAWATAQRSAARATSDVRDYRGEYGLPPMKTGEPRA